MQATLLVASPQMLDPFFEKAVLLVWHHDEDGSMGVVVNRTLEDAAARGVMPRSESARLGDVLMLDQDVDLHEYAQQPVNWGGPVDTDSGTLITTTTLDDAEGWAVPGGLHVTRSQDALLRLIGERAQMMLCLGYAGWGPGQLEREVAEGSWLFVEPSAGILFDIDPEDRWRTAIRTLGLEPEWVLMNPIEA